jgi:ATPase subunit of ABC transporter with duplicated ATPase domains
LGSIQVAGLSWRRPGGEWLFDDVSFRVGAGERVALVGPNGAGKTTLLRLITGAMAPDQGTISVDGSMAVMTQLVGSIRDETTLRDLYTSLAPERFRRAATVLTDVERQMAAEPTDHDLAMAYAEALAAWGELGGYELEVRWDAAAQRVLGAGMDDVGARPLATFSGGEQKRLALELLLRGEDELLVLDEPDNFLDIPSKRWLEEQLVASRKTILLVSHDRTLLAAVATKVVTIEAGDCWTHGGGFATYHDARAAHLEQREQDHALHAAERQRLVELVVEMRQRAKISETFAPRLKAAESRLRQFDEREAPPPPIRDQQISVRLGGQRTGRKALTLNRLEIHGLTDPFDLEVWYGDPVAVLGPNGAGKSHFLRLLAGDPEVGHDGEVALGARVVPGHFNQTHDHPELIGLTLLDILLRHDVVRGPAMGKLRRYELDGCAEQPFETLSGGQQARLQILLLELEGATMLLLDEPTDNLDLMSAEALEAGLASFDGTVLAVTHDRWFLRGFDRFVVFGDDGSVRDLLEPPPDHR